MENTNQNAARVKCPYCGYVMQISYDERADCSGLYVRCKGRNCRRVFEIKIKNGKQNR